jgi:Domain of unknown function (DUF4226)
MVVERGAGEYGQAMAEQGGRSIEAIGETQTALAKQHTAAAEADRALTDALASAHAATVEGVRRLDAIAAEIDHAVANQAAMGLDTSMGAREFQKFLIAKQREIRAVVAEAHEVNVAKKALLQQLTEHYTGSPASR